MSSKWKMRKARQHKQQSLIEINAAQRTSFHAATIKVWLPVEGKWLDVLVDLGAAASVMKLSSVIRGVRRGLKRISNSIRMIAANGEPVGTLLGTTSVEMQFSRGGESVHHVTSVIDNERMPDILGVDFFEKYEAEISFATKSLSLKLGDQRIEVPFTVNGRGWDDETEINSTTTQSECTAQASITERLILLPGYYAHVDCTIIHPSAKLHCSQTYVVDSLLNGGTIQILIKTHA